MALPRSITVNCRKVVAGFVDSAGSKHPKSILRAIRLRSLGSITPPYLWTATKLWVNAICMLRKTTLLLPAELKKISPLQFWGAIGTAAVYLGKR